jgi:transcriptional regulator with XRE-family HTH domain
MAINEAKIIDQRVADRIREQRKRIGMTQQALARMIGVAFQQAHKYEHGLSRISAGRLYQLASALKAPITYFFAAEDEAKKHEEASAGPGTTHGHDR